MGSNVFYLHIALCLSTQFEIRLYGECRMLGRQVRDFILAVAVPRAVIVKDMDQVASKQRAQSYLLS